VGRKHAKIISQDAFKRAFIEGEMVMRLTLGARIQTIMDAQSNEDTKAGLQLAKDIVYGKVESVNDLG